MTKIILLNNLTVLIAHIVICIITGILLFAINRLRINAQVADMISTTLLMWVWIAVTIVIYFLLGLGLTGNLFRDTGSVLANAASFAILFVIALPVWLYCANNGGVWLIWMNYFGLYPFIMAVSELVKLPFASPWLLAAPLLPTLSFWAGMLLKSKLA